MIEKKDPEFIEVSISNSYSKNIIPIQDNLNIDLNQLLLYPNITKKQKDFIKKMNKSFFYEFGKLKNKNILLKAKLKDLLKEKQRLNQIIIEKEHKRNREKSKIKGINNDNNNSIDNNNKNENILQNYRKRKRIRRKKSEIVYAYFCNFPNCNKSYPTKGSLNMHIKLKHQKNLDRNENIK